jgi:hypothetical protein
MARYVVLLSFLVLMAGCGRSGYGQVEGKVTFQGRPLPGAIVFFVPERGPAAAGATGDDGSYHLLTKRPGDGAVTGRCKVAIVSIDPVAKPLPIPKKYFDAETSGLTAEVEEGRNMIDFALKDAK